MSKLVSINQSGYVKERLMNDIIRTIYDIIDICRYINSEGILMMSSDD